jgi:serine/threonine protein phosphatase PrpC
MTRDTQQPLADVSDADDTMTTVVPARSNIRWDSFGSSNVGKIRSINEDAYLDAGDRALWLVADGMGGHSAGDVASGAIAEAFDLLTPPVGLSDFVDLAESTLIALNEKFLEMANFGRDGATIGSTVVVLAERQGWMIYLWAGDSRLYRWRRGELHQLI